MNAARLKLYGQTVELEKKCFCDYGIVRAQIHTEDQDEKCSFCGGTGYTLTDTGREIARFIQHQFKLEPKQYIGE